jgi:hypothetical protein
VSYIERQAALDAQYRRAWDELSVEERSALAAAGIDGPDCGREPAPDQGREVVCREDAAVICDRHCGVEIDYAAAADGLADQLAEDFGVTAAQAEALAKFIEGRTNDALRERHSLMLARIVGFFLAGSENLQARAHGLAHAARMASLNGLRSLRHSALLCGVSVEWMRRVAWKWCDLLELPPLEGAKSAEARAAYAHDKRTNHWRNKKCTLSPKSLNQAA